MQCSCYIKKKNSECHTNTKKNKTGFLKWKQNAHFKLPVLAKQLIILIIFNTQYLKVILNLVFGVMKFNGITRYRGAYKDFR